MTSTFDLSALRAAATVPVQSMHDYTTIYFLGDHTGLFAGRGAQIVHALPSFAGVVLFSVTPAKQARIAAQLQFDGVIDYITTEELLARGAQALASTLVIDFNETLAGKVVAQRLADAGVVVCDFLYALHELELTHTYATVRAERDYVIAHLDRFERAGARLSDRASREALHARLAALIRLDRTPLIDVSFPLGDFMNNFAPTAGIVVRPDEVFIDAGAAHGDTVSQLCQISRNRYRSIHAFEPDATNFASLDKLASFLPNVHTYFAGLGARSGSRDFYENPNNRFGSTFFASPTGGQVAALQMTMLALDDVVEDATLIKIDVEGFEAAVVTGAARVIASSRPNMTISAYHYPHDIIELLDTVLAIHPYRHVGMRHYGASLFDTQLMFSDSQAFD
jgi:FkbM family methyltransferase